MDVIVPFKKVIDPFKVKIRMEKVQRHGGKNLRERKFEKIKAGGKVVFCIDIITLIVQYLRN